MRHRKTQVDLAKMCGVFKQEITHVGNGRYDSGRIVEDVARAMQCHPDWLLKGLGPEPRWLPDAHPVPEPIIKLPGARALPVIGTAGAADAGQRGLLYDTPEARQLSADLALVEVHGRSAYPVAYDGQLAVVHLKRPVRPNNIVVVVMGEDNDVLVKRWCPQRDGTVVLASPDGGRDSLAVPKDEIKKAWPVVGVLFEAL
ncbi:MAG: Peptidase S24-like [Pseudomonadota bacterium]